VHDAHHLEHVVTTADAESLPDRIDARPQLLGDRLVDYGDPKRG
jgi:hypothetical protein